MSAFEALVAALVDRKRPFGDWSVRGRKVTRATASTVVTRHGRRDEVAAQVHVDTPEGRGSADLALDSPEPVEHLLDEARGRAVAAIGPAWRSSPPAAPAKVSIADGAVVDPDEVAADLLAALTAAATAAGAELVDAAMTVERAEVAIATSRGLASRWTETRLALDAVIAIDGRTARLTHHGRRRADLHVDDQIAGAVARARDRGAAGATPPGRRAVLISAALLGGDGALLLDAIAALADASLHRQGLARARVGAPIVDGAETAEEPVSVSSDGTLRFGLRSAPLGAHGEPVRRFPIVDRGLLVGLALDEREGALRGTPPNGGVANLVVSIGASDDTILRAADVLELRELTYVDLEPLTGRVAVGIGLATVHGTTPQTVAGGELQGDLVAALARSRRSATLAAFGGYAGPDLILLAGLHVT